MGSSDYPTALQITQAVQQEPTVNHGSEATIGRATGSCRGQAVPVTYFSRTTHLTNDSSDFRSTRAAALTFTLKVCLGPLLSSMWVCKGAARHHEARCNLRSGTGWTPFGQIAGPVASSL